MNSPEVNQKITPVEPKITVGSVVEKVRSILTKIREHTPVPVKNALAKFYLNKKIFWPVTVAFSLIFLITIMGLVFGSKPTSVVPPPKKTQTPLVLQTPTASPEGDILTVTENKLKVLNGQINALDVGQGKLKPPAIDYNVSF